MDGFLEWYAAEALQEGGKFQSGLAHALAPGESLPTPSLLLFGKGVELLADTRCERRAAYRRGVCRAHHTRAFRAAVCSGGRFGEYQLGMAVRYSRGTFHNTEIATVAKQAPFESRRLELRAARTRYTVPLAPSRRARRVLCGAHSRVPRRQEATRPEFEERIAAHMQYHGVAYFGRLVMLEPDGSWLSVSRYGSIDDAERGTAAVRALMADEVRSTCPATVRPRPTALTRVCRGLQVSAWFSSYESIYGTASRVMEL